VAKPSVRRPLPSQNAIFGRVEDERKDKELDEAAQKASENRQEEDDYQDYDKYVRELAFDQRAKPTDRTKTEEEIALEEKENLEKAEKARKRRMEGLESEDEDDTKSGRRAEKGRVNKKRKRAPQGDDLDDDYVEDEGPQLGHGLTLEDIMNAKPVEEEEEEEEEEGEEESDITDLESEDAVSFSEDDGDDMNEVGANGKIAKVAQSNGKIAKTASRQAKKIAENYEIPYTFDCPSTHVEFLNILQQIRLEDTPTVAHRICVLHHIKLAASNRQKLEVCLYLNVTTLFTFY
jgi:nucleolar protein 14